MVFFDRKLFRLSLAAWLATLFLSTASDTEETAAAARHWAFQTPNASKVPEVRDTGWLRTAVDAFILARLEEHQLEPSPRADRRTLLRRLSFDLIGLPPSLAEIDAFVVDERPDAYERNVDRLLATPRFGERWAQHWLDVVRYADSDGFEYDTPRPSAWRYRDWVIDSLNADLPYDEFVRQQIAGDELRPGDTAGLIAAGLHRLGPLRENAGNQDLPKIRQELLTEMTDALGVAFLGVTLGCARCHDHKFDPISQADYYSLQAFFAATRPKNYVLASPEEQTAHKKRVADWKAQTKALSEKIDGLPAEDSQRARYQAELADLERAKPQALPTVRSVTEELADGKVPGTFVLHRGEPGQLLEEVWPRFADALNRSELIAATTPDAPSGRRAALARWIGSDRNPLVSRTHVNRVWMHHFARGLVETTSDLGNAGAELTHPKLLDWLAVRFVEDGWSVKRLHRRLVTTATYRQSSASPEGREDAETIATADSDNALLWRMRRRRRDAESLRDTVLAVSGSLNLKSGGFGVRLPLSQEVADQQYAGKWKPTEDPQEHVRRSVYLFIKRTIQVPLLEALDAPNRVAACAKRTVSIHAGQALALLNGPFVDAQARAFAKRLLADENLSDASAIVVRGYEIALGRLPTEGERRRAEAFLRASGTNHDAVADLCLVLLNLNEFHYVD